MKTTVYGKSDLGRKRQNNEDNFCIVDDLNLFVVADGMGGAASGQVASKIAVDVIKEQMLYTSKNKKIDSSSLVSCIKMANQVIFEASQKYPQNSGMGTTVVAGLITGNKLTIAHVGDSRLYLIRNNNIDLLTEDHSIVMEQVRKGMITLEEANKSEIQNILTRALGTSESVEVDVSEVPLSNKDYLLLCSDGLTRMVEDNQFLEVIKALKEPELICEKLITIANDAGGKDNITVIVAYIQKGIFSWFNN
ncbi:MAG: Stp1/IreP family PP2C-type Ser/Thr phosphatase [Elusimicrobia bacterium]|nr:Stp1/IreP family PP2C-type Ser/Thr phosphatase [Elusimicrobiota bacterium]